MGYGPLKLWDMGYHHPCKTMLDFIISYSFYWCTLIFIFEGEEGASLLVWKWWLL